MKNARYLPFALVAITLVWYAALVVRFPTQGALGDDPATYVQMARDLVRHGSVTHAFPLLTKLFDQGFSWDAFITPGYHIVGETGATAPNFAFGFPLLLALAARVLGETALYWATPLMGALSLLATFALAKELFCDVTPARRYWIGAIAILLLATTPKQIQLVLALMSDVPAQLFCVVALWCALRVTRPDSFRNPARSVYAILCGLALGVGYLIRPSALALLLPLAVVVTRWGVIRRQRLILIFIALAVFAVVVSPDIVYHVQVLGSVFAVPSPESAKVVWQDAPRRILEMLAALFSVTGFGPIVLLAPLGWWLLVRDRNRFAAVVLISWILAFMLLHAPLYLTGVFENNLRYLLPAYPALALSVSVACVWIAGHAWNAFSVSRARFVVRAIFLYVALGITVLLFVLAARAVISPERFARRAYGWMGETTRNDLEALNQQLPPDAVIGTSDQMAGATLLYAQREIFRPANFLEPASEFPRFLAEMKSEKRAVFLLGDWNCAPDADASEELPAWLAEYKSGEWRLEIRDLPYGCAEKVYQVQ